MSPDTIPTEAELRFYYYGLYALLRRYRTITILGWIVVLLGLASFPLSWRLGTPHGLLDTLLSGGTVVAGLALVQLAVGGLTAYLQVPFDERPGALPDVHPAIRSIREIMRDIDDGGWQEAYGAIRKLEGLRDEYGLPPLTSS